MNKTVLKVFLIIGVLVLVFIIWQLVFNDGGILKTGYNSVASVVNHQWEKVAGKNQTLLTTWGTANAEDNGTAFDINTKKK